jgi:hypothetical protein
MSNAPVFGRVDNPEQLNLDPFKFTLAGYKVQPDGSNEEVLHEFTASGVRPFYMQIEFVRAAAAESGILGAQAIADFVEQSLLDDAERQRFRETLETPGVFFDAEVLASISNWLSETYTGRPTRPRTARRSGPARGGQRSTGAGTAKAGAISAGSPRGQR